MGPPVRVFIVDDSPLIRKRIIENLHALGGFDVVGFAEAEEAAVAAIVETRQDGSSCSGPRVADGKGEHLALTRTRISVSLPLEAAEARGRRG